MSLQAFEIEELITRYLNNELTGEERQALDEWLTTDKNKKFFDEFTHQQTLQGELAEYKYFVDRKNDGRKKLRDLLLLASTPVVPVKRMWAKYVVAAAVTTVVTTGVVYLSMPAGKKQDVVKTTPAPAIKQDVPPGGDKAILTLADGSTVVLDDAQNGLISTQGNADVVKKDGELTYAYSGKKPMVRASYNLLRTPRGGKYQVILPDGSKAYLNAASSIRYPVAFTGDSRKVEMTGEVFFEVKKNAKMPFRVAVLQETGASGEKAEVEVLGTHFNVNAYTDELAVKTTLVEGKVKVSVADSDRSAVLKPGEQGQMNAGGNIDIKKVNVDVVTAWKNGLFRFHDVDLKTIMRQISRWYDVEIIFDSNVNSKYSFILNRNFPVSRVLEILEQSGGVHFKIDGKTIRVLP